MKSWHNAFYASAMVLAVASAPSIRTALAADADTREPEVVLTTQAVGGVAVPTTGWDKAKKYENDPDAITAGKGLYAAFNCNGCHAGGGGGFGPALSDQKWIYGGSLPNIVDTLYEGRPKGMPAWRGKIPDEQMWQLAAYVKSLSKPGGLAPPL
ncbi:c-type cytochrome [Methylobacterium sp. E-041]|jgi:cytochrome c oxidase cbb3-type subunit 3|uniref:c-type cytochrome n=1 Tax=Methylobacterium sp. E-041 TaxID=2836573 RepID=UPI001FB8C2EE|nr:c-type cytochrome [Methylobacterium sp. E-041]MCJ2107338.1 c-type cytochrome [Methylobacterium sp. E-041]